MKLEVKKRRKEHQRESKRAKAILDGRDVEKERREIEERTKEGEGRKRREKVSFIQLWNWETNNRVLLPCTDSREVTFKYVLIEHFCLFQLILDRITSSADKSFQVSWIV
jgi:hypothetical protein